MLTSAQREWVHAHELLLHVKPEKRGHRPTSWWRVLSYDIVHVRARCRRDRPTPLVTVATSPTRGARSSICSTASC